MKSLYGFSRLCHMIGLFITLLFLSCAPKTLQIEANPEEVAIIESMISTKKQAVIQKDSHLYLSSIDKKNKEFYFEQKRWFQYYQNSDVKNYNLQIIDTKKINDNKYVASLKQSYFYVPKKIKYSLKYKEEYIKAEEGWKDAGLYLSNYETEHFIVKAPHNLYKGTIKKVADDAESAYRIVTQLYGEDLNDKTVIMLFTDQNLIKQSIKVHIPRLVPGWYEYPESIKIYIKGDHRRSFEKIVAHELAHKITLSTSQNLCAWFAEGLAVYYGTFNSLGKTYIEKHWTNKIDHIKPIDWLEEQDPEKLITTSKILVYYGTAGLVIKHIKEMYGNEKDKEILKELSKFPQNEEGFEFVLHNDVYLDYLHQVMETVLKVDMQTFNSRWMTWIKSL